MIDRVVSGVLVLLAIQVAPAFGASAISVTGGELVLVETAPAASVLGVAEASGSFTIIDWSTAPIAAGTGCTPDASLPFLVYCSGPVTAVRLSLGEGDDTAAVGGPTPAILDGGPGDDTLTGGTGNDVLRGGLGADVLNGGAGTDTADYAWHPLQPVMVTPDDSADDGGPREGDDVRPDVELAVTLPAPTTVALDCDELRIRTHDDADNILGIALASGSLVVIDWTGHSLAAGAGCSLTPGMPFLATCAAAGVARLRVDSGDGDDTIAAGTPLPAILHGGAGDDSLTGGDAGDVLLGGAGNDVLGGGAGNDVLDGGLGADVLAGGAGTDRVNYRGHALQPVSVTFDGVANDGGPGEGDDVRSNVETASTTPASPVVWVWGDSNTHGYGPYLVAEKPEWDVVSLGVGGETAAGGLTRVVNTLAQTPPSALPDVAVVMYGTNDIVHDLFLGEPGFDPPDVGANVAAIAGELEAAGARVLIGFPLGAPFPRSSLSPELNALVLAMQAEYDAQIPFFDRCSSGRENVDFRLQSNSQFATNSLGAFHASDDVYENDWVFRAIRGIEEAVAVY